MYSQKNVIMKAIQYTKKVSTNILRLIYSTCTNDLVINSKQASVIEDFFLAFCIEFNRLFIADSLLMNVLQKHCIVKAKIYIDHTKSICRDNFLEDRNAFLEFFGSNENYSILNKMRLFEKTNN